MITKRIVHGWMYDMMIIMQPKANTFSKNAVLCCVCVWIRKPLFHTDHLNLKSNQRVLHYCAYTAAL